MAKSSKRHITENEGVYSGHVCYFCGKPKHLTRGVAYRRSVYGKRIPMNILGHSSCFPLDRESGN